MSAMRGGLDDMSDDYIVRAVAARHQVRAFAITGRGIVEDARKIHDTSPVATDALGRLLLAGSMMGSMMKDERDVLTLRIECEGPIGGLMVSADANARVKGYVNKPRVALPPNKYGKFDVSGALGAGFLNVIRDTGMKEPYNGSVALVSGEIAEDLTYYYATSEQTPSSVGLGVSIDGKNFVRQAGGFIIQVMPDADEDVIDALENSIAGIESVTGMLEAGMTPEDMLKHILKGMSAEILEKTPAAYYCGCSKERAARAVAGIGRRDLREMIDDGKPIEVNCQFCNSRYIFNVGELKGMMR